MPPPSVNTRRSSPHPRKALLRVPRRRLRQGQGRVRHAGYRRADPEARSVAPGAATIRAPAHARGKEAAPLGRRTEPARALDQVRRVQDRSAQSRSGPRDRAPPQSRRIPQHRARPARRRLQHRPRIPAGRYRLRLRQHRRRADHLAHAHGEVRRGRADRRRRGRADARRASPSNRSSRACRSRAQARASSGASASSCSASRRTSARRSRRASPAAIA